MAYPYEAANAYQSADGKQNVEQKNTYQYIATATATQLKTGAGLLDVVSGLTGTQPVSFYDVANGTIASLASLSQIGIFPAVGTATANNPQPVASVPFHAQYNNGLYVVASSATMPVVTVSYS
jgi:hypothetical protein